MAYQTSSGIQFWCCFITGSLLVITKAKTTLEFPVRETKKILPKSFVNDVYVICSQKNLSKYIDGNNYFLTVLMSRKEIRALL